MANGSPESTTAALVETLVACPEDELLHWMGEHQQSLSTSVLQHLKDHYVTASHILTDPQQTDRLTNYALTVAGLIATKEPMALALAQWMRGLWAMYNNMAEAVLWFRSALPAYEAINDTLSIARLYANLVAVLAAVGKNQEAEECYNKAHPFCLAYAGQDPKYLIYLEQSFGLLLQTWGRYEESLIVHNRALMLATEHKLQISIAEIQVNLALTLACLGRLAEVESMLQQDRGIALTLGELVTVARIDMNLGELYTSQGRPVEALRCFQLAADGFVAMEQGFVLARQATLLRQLGALPAALRQYEAAIKSIGHYDLKPFLAETLINHASCLRLLGGKQNLKRATQQLDQAEDIWRALGNDLCVAQVYSERIWIALAKNNLREAFTLLKNFPAPSANLRTQAEYHLLRGEVHRLANASSPELIPSSTLETIAEDYQSVLNFATKQGWQWLRRSAYQGLGKLYLTSDWQRACGWLEEAATIDDQIRQMLTLEELKATFHDQSNDLYDDLIQQAYLHQEIEQMLLYSWRAKASAFLDLAQDMKVEADYTDSQQQEITLLRQQIAALRWSLAKQAADTPASDSYEKNSPELAALTHRLLDVRRQAKQQAIEVTTLTVEQMRSVLARMDADILLEYVRCGEDIYGICATRMGICQAIRLAETTTIAEISGHLGLSFRAVSHPSAKSSGTTLTQSIQDSHIFLQQCYELLLFPFAETLSGFASNSRLLIAPCDTLSMLPFAAFWTGTHYLLHDFEIELIQSGALLLLSQPIAKIHSPSCVIAASAEKVIQVRDEARLVAQQLQTSVTFIDVAALHYLDALPMPPRILHIAAHTIQQSISPFFSGIQLSGEVLSVEHCFDLPLWGCELVTLSGCATAAGLESDAALFAFQSAFLLAGAKRILCSLWAIDDGLPGTIMETLYQKLNQGLPASAALRQTQQALLQSSTHCHPAVWAAFTSIRR